MGFFKNDSTFKTRYLGGYPTCSKASPAKIEISNNYIRVMFEIGNVVTILPKQVKSFSIKGNDEARVYANGNKQLLNELDICKRKGYFEKEGVLLIHCDNYRLFFTSKTNDTVYQTLKNFFGDRSEKESESKVEEDEFIIAARRVKELKSLLDIDAITEEEFEKKKRELLNL